MKRAEALPETGVSARRGIAPWKFAAGVLIHLSVPAYLLTLFATGVAYLLEHGTAEGVFSLLPGVSLYFVMLYAAVTVAGIGIAALAGLIGRARRNRRSIRLGESPAMQSRQALSRAVQILGAMTDDAAVLSALDMIGQAAWHHDEERYQQLSRDLDRAAMAYSSAHASAPGAQGEDVSRLTAETLRHVARKLDDLARDRAVAAAQKAQTMAGYIASKYGDDLDAVR